MSHQKPDKLSPDETVKAESHYLRGPILDELASSDTHVSKVIAKLLKHHGTYQQDNRDERITGGSGKSGKSYSFMVRTAIPGGKLTSGQLLAELDLCDELGDTTLRITTRQGLQLHGILKRNLRQTIRRINQVQLTTLAACGDVERNVMSPPCPYKRDPVYTQLQELADQLAEHLRPHTRAYHQIWLNDDVSGDRTLVGGKRHAEVVPESDQVEPLYGPTYLPRKFKTAIGLPGDNSVDVYTNDVGLLAICENWRVVGYNVLAGGGFGLTPAAQKTFAAIAEPLGYIPAEQVVDVVTAILRVQRDFGNRADRKVARLKYLIRNWGVDRFRSTVEQYLGASLQPYRAVDVTACNDGLDWQAQGDGRWFYGLHIDNGRIKDTPTSQLKSALRAICQELAPPLRLTPYQSLIFCDIESSQRVRLEEILTRHKVPLSETVSRVRRWSMACPALPTCGLAITESERMLPGIIDQLEKELQRLGLSDEVFGTRMTGCPNGCTRPYNSDIGLVGKAKGKYTILLGGRSQGDRLNWIYRDLVPAGELVPTLVRVLTFFRNARLPGEKLGEFCHRLGKETLLAECEKEPVQR